MQCDLLGREVLVDFDAWVEFEERRQPFSVDADQGVRMHVHLVARIALADLLDHCLKDGVIADVALQVCEKHGNAWWLVFGGVLTHVKLLAEM